MEPKIIGKLQSHYAYIVWHEFSLKIESVLVIDKLKDKYLPWKIENIGHNDIIHVHMQGTVINLSVKYGASTANCIVA